MAKAKKPVGKARGKVPARAKARPAAKDKYAVIDRVMGRMTLEQKVGQLFTQAFYGSLVVPDVIRTIKQLNCGGLRITQYFRGFRRYAKAGQEGEAFDKLSPDQLTPNLLDDRKDLLCTSPYLTVNQYSEVLKRLKDIAAERPYDVPLVMMLDQEGGASFDCCRGGIRYFPSQFGYARTGDEKLVYDVARANAEQLSAIGFNTINSPVVDIVFNPKATYIRTRAFGTDVDTVSRLAVAAMKGYHDGGLIAAAKHFPGRGATDVDAHHDVGAIDKSDEALWNEDLAPYRAMIPAGLRALMVGHSIYPAWDPDDIASVSRKVITGIVHERMGFQGMICTDSMIMGAIQKKYGVAGGCLAAIKAGASAVLMKECGPIREESYRLVMEAVKSGEITEDYVDSLVIRNLRTKVDAGLFGPAYKHDPKAAESVVRSKKLERIEIRAAEEAVHVVRDTKGWLPLKASTRALLVEQVAAPHLRTNDQWVHPGIFWEQLCRHTENVALLEVETNPKPEDIEKVKTYLEFFDTVIVTFYKDRHTLGVAQIVDDCLAAGKRVIVVADNPLPYELPDAWPTVVASYGVMPPVLKVAADLIYGRFKPKRKKQPQAWEAQ
jgi:beta-N-acetylhexosaminidase